MVDSWDDLNDAVQTILGNHGDSDLVWRGVTDATYGLFSSLYRRKRAAGGGQSITENELLHEEARILQAARERWRLDHMGALEIMAHIQHYGGPTRLIDVTVNPLIAAWFACEDQYRNESSNFDGRLFCFYVGEWVELDSSWGGRSLPWAEWTDTASRLENDWGTGKKRRVWRPPLYNSRISAQNAAFILDGVPMTYAGWNDFTKGPGIKESWRIGDLRGASSVPLKLNDPKRAKQRENSRPAFSIRIAAKAKSEIRRRLEKNYGYSVSSIYSDLFGLAQHVAPHLPTE